MAVHSVPTAPWWVLVEVYIRFTLETESNIIPSGAVNNRVCSLVLVPFLTAVC